MLNVSTARQRKTSFGNSPYTLWTDADGNLQLVCISEYESGNIFLSVRTYEAFKALPCQGKRSIRFRNANARLDETRLLDELEMPSPVEKDGKPPFFLIGKEDLSATTTTAAYPSYVGTESVIPF